VVVVVVVVVMVNASVSVSTLISQFIPVFLGGGMGASGFSLNLAVR